MDVTFYTTKDSKNTINKTLENPVVFNDIKVKDEYNESNPSFYIHSKDNLLNSLFSSGLLIISWIVSLINSIDSGLLGFSPFFIIYSRVI